jgi:glycosyltransferase involved in cell wall biosynthesis
MPMFNAESFVSASLRSIQGQSLPDIEIIVIDDGSQDGSAGVVQAAAELDSRIRLISQPNRGVAAARNHGIAEARADLIAFQDADDESLPERLARQYAFLHENPDIGLVACNAYRVGERGQVLGVFDAGPTSREEFATLRGADSPIYLVTTSVMARRLVLTEAGCFPPALTQGAEDLALWNRVADQSILLTIPERLVRYRVHRSGLSGSRFAGQMRETALVAENIKRRRQGEPEMTSSEFDAVLAAEPWPARFSRARDWKSKHLYRIAGSLLADRNPIGLLPLFGAFALKPSTVVNRMRAQIVPWLRTPTRRGRRGA